MSHAHEQLDSIHAMLAAGHRSVHLERHSLLLIGGVGGFLAASTQLFINADRFPDTGNRAIALLCWLAFWLGGASILDNWLTRRARKLRDEVLPFAQAQITRAWWMLLAVGCLGSFAMFFYGGGAMIYCLWIVLLGLGIYLFGLFSRPLIEWIGLAAILLGVTGLATHLPYGATRWLTASSFAIGMPLTGFLASKVNDRSLVSRLLALLCWLALVAAPPLIWAAETSIDAPRGPLVPIASSAADSGSKTVRIEAGTSVPLEVTVDGPIFAPAPTAKVGLKLAMPMEVALQDGQPDGRYRVGDGPWHRIQDGVLNLRIDHISPARQNGAPVIYTHASLELAKVNP